MRHLLLLLVAAVAAAQNPTLGRKVVFEDQFNAPAVDASKWNVGNPDLVKIEKGKLVLGFQQTPGGVVGGNLNTNGRFAQQFGYFEASIRFNAFQGHRGTFGVRSEKLEELPSAAMKFDGAGLDRIFPWGRFANAQGSRDAQPPKWDGILTGGKGYKRFNEYGILWTEKAITWYMEGKKIMQIEKPDPLQPMVLFLSHYFLEDDRKHFKEKNLPDNVEFEWVKVWK
ncbi:MAG: family 16 glycosylhydrolase [Opitutia bacterium]